MGVEIEEIRDGDLVWISSMAPPKREWLYVRLESGQVALGWHDGAWWTTDGFRVHNSSLKITHWAEIRYPEGPRNAS